MKRRFLVAAAVLAAAVAGCSSPPAALGNHDAKVMINGKATNALQPVTCNQTGQAWTIKTVDKDPGFTATIQLGDEVKAQTVEIRNLGKAQARVSPGKFSISGEAQGAFADKPNQSATATFDITTTC